ncbi:MAG: hypothetical protein ACYDER_24005 [Ktedonobacteraceae bacterium]
MQVKDTPLAPSHAELAAHQPPSLHLSAAFRHRLFSFAFRLPVGWAIQAPPSECFLGTPGIQVKRDAAHT